MHAGHCPTAIIVAFLGSLLFSCSLGKGKDEPVPEAVPGAVARAKNSVDAALWERGQELFSAKLEAQRKQGLLEKLPTIPGTGHV